MSNKSPKSNKVILSEEDIISRNAKESADFAEKVEAFINSDLPPNEVIRIGTLNCLQVLNSPNTPRVPLIIPQSVLANALGVKLSGQTKRQHTEPHNISVKAAKQMPDHLRSPICICKGNRPNTVVIVTDLIDGTGGNIIVPINTDAKTSGKSRVYKVASFYAKKNISSYIENAVINGTLLAVNIKKADMCSRNFSANIGRQLSKFGALICFNDSIAYSLKNVKGFSEKYLENFQTSKDIEHPEHLVETIPQQQDSSHKITNAALSAKRGESRGNIMEQNTKFEVSTMSKLEGDGPAKAIATLVVNGEFAVHGVKVVEGRNGLYTAMPSEKQGNGEYKDVVFPVTSEARAAIENAVLDTYEKLLASPEKNIKNDIAAPEKPVSKVYAQMHEVKSDSTQTKAAGQLTIDSCLVVTGVKLNEGTNAQGQTKNFVAMPARMNANGTYDDVAHPITADFHNKVDKAVIASANNIGRYEYKGVKYAELGENSVSSKPLHPKFADKLMNELDKAGIPYQAKCGERTTITVAAGDNQKFETVKKELTEKLNANDKPKQTQEQKQTTGTRSTH